MRKYLTAVLVIMTLMVPAVIYPGTAQAAITQQITMCEHNEAKQVQYGNEHSYLVRNPYWKGQGEQCIRTNGASGAGFQVLKTPVNGHGQVVGYPAIMRGCYWNKCTSDMRLPIRVSNIHHVSETLKFRRGANGTYNSSNDIWFGKHKQTQGHADGAELMIWQNYHGGCCFLSRNAQLVHIQGRAYWFSHWRSYDADHGGVSWNYIQFRMVHQTWSVRGFGLKPFVKFCIHRGLIRNSWWMENLQAGFEIWSGGHGLGIESFKSHVW